MDIIIPKIQSKYITAFKNESSYDAAYPTFEEVNWSAIKPAVGPEELPDEYRLSRRLSHMYANGTPPDYKFSSVEEYVPYDAQTEEEKTYADAHQIAHHNTEGCPANRMTPDDMRKTFFLEIVWGYSGWEWHDYERVIGTDPETEEPITETLKGGNLYKIKDIQTVPHIIDGDRLQHINDFLFSQYNVTRVEGFNTENVVAANRAFKRGTNDDTTYPKRNSSQILECHFVEGYDEQGDFNHPFGYADLITGENLLENLMEADGLFYNNKVYMYEGDFANVIPFTIPNITHIDRLYSYGVYTNGLKFKMNSLTKLTNAFKMAIFPQDTINVNNIFVDNTLKNIDNFSGMFGGASLTGYKEINGDKVVEVSLDITSSNIDSNDTIDLTGFLEYCGPSEMSGNGFVDGSKINVNLNFNNKINLTSAFNYVLNAKGDAGYDIWTWPKRLWNKGFKKIDVDFNSKESYITSLKLAFANNTFIENLPVQQVPNNTCDDSYIYKSCVFNAPISYNFLNGSIVSPRTQGYGQFNDCTINDSYAFSNIQGLDRAEFCGIKFGNNVLAADKAFLYVVQNQNDTTYRYFDMANSKFVGTLPAQNIYIDSAGMKSAVGKYNTNIGDLNRLNPFQGCSELTDLSNINLYYSDDNEEWNGISFNFNSCTNITKTPYIHFKYIAGGDRYLRCNINCAGLKNLTEVNFENFSFRGGSVTIGSSHSFRDCTSLVYLKIATNTTDGFDANLDVRGCTNIDADTLKSTLLIIKSGYVQILDSTWKKVNGINPSAPGDVDSGPVYDYFIAQGIGCAVTKDASYTPVYPD